MYPPSVPVNLELIENGVAGPLLRSRRRVQALLLRPVLRRGDVPANDALSIRHTTRNFPNREGSKPGDGQLSGVV